MGNSEIDDLLKVSDLISGYIKGNLTITENAELFSWVNKSKSNKELFYSILNEKELENNNARSRSFDIQAALIAVKEKLQPAEARVYKLKLRHRVLAAAASVILFMAIGITVYFQQKKPQVAVVQKHIEIKPGGNKAILTLANGKQILLNSLANGKITSQADITIQKMADGLLTYKVTSIENTAAAQVYNTINTPKGGQYRVILADGTNVWLNAASSIKFPVSFNASDRRVQITGEAYFEVAHDSKRPFMVESAGQTIEVLGTHFNVNAYADENEVKTTLLQGSVKINVAGKSYFLKPGQQSQLSSGTVNISNADTEEAVAWKNKIFHFNDASIESVMRQLSRWYDVDVNYEGKIPQRTFSGEISMNVNASQILDAMNFKKIHYTIEGRTITVKP